MDPITAFGVATTAFNAIKKGFQVGRDVESMSKDLGRWMGAIQDVKEGHNKKKNRVFGSVEEEALETFAIKKKAIAMENDLRNFVDLSYGPNAWNEVIRIQADIRKQKKEAIEEAKRNLWGFNLSHGRDAIQHTIYKEGGGHYDWHMDAGHGMQRHRKVSLTVQLTDPDDYEGGKLQLWRGQNPLDAPRGKGTVVIFPSYMMHRVSEVTKGTRESLVLWVGGDHYR